MTENCDRCTISNCSILDCDNVALSLKDCTKCIVSDCLVRDDRTEAKATKSLKLEGGKENWIKGNLFGERDGSGSGRGRFGGQSQ